MAARSAAMFVVSLLNDGQFLFDTIANFTHNFFKPFAVTFDYLDMNLYLT